VPASGVLEEALLAQVLELGEVPERVRA